MNTEELGFHCSNALAYSLVCLYCSPTIPSSISNAILFARRQLNKVVPPDHLPQSCRFEVFLVSKAVYISISSPPNCCPLVIVVAATIMNWSKSFDLKKFSTVLPTCVYSPATFFLALRRVPRLLIVLVYIVKGILHCKHFQHFLELSGVAELQAYYQCNYFFQVPLGPSFWIPPHSSTRTFTVILFLLLTIHTVKCFTVIRLCIEIIYWITSIL